jgi:hypothetical protein
MQRKIGFVLQKNRYRFLDRREIACVTPIDTPNPCAIASMIRILARRLSTSRRGHFAALIWLPVQSQSGGELPLSGKACRVAASPSFRRLFLLSAIVSPSEQGHGQWPGGPFFCVSHELTLP